MIDVPNDRRAIEDGEYFDHRDALAYLNEIEQLQAENTLMNELVSDQVKTIENLKASVDRLCRALLAAGVNATTVRNIASG